MIATLWHIALSFFRVSLVAIGGANAVIPEIHVQVVENRAWMNDATFANLFAIAQAAPGPNVQIVSLIGWYVAGIAGLCVATAAMILPSSLLAFIVGRILNRLADARAVRILKEGMVPIATGLMLAAGIVMGRAADHSMIDGILTVGTAAFVSLAGRNPLWALATAAAVGVAARHLGIAI